MKPFKDHPFAMQARFHSSIVLAYAVPKEELEPLIPEPLELDTWDNHWGFVAAALVDTRAMRPAGFPEAFGQNFFLIGYRIFVRYRNAEGRRLRGLFILGSQTNKYRMQVAGNLFSSYKYTSIDIGVKTTSNQSIISSSQTGLFVDIDRSTAEVALPKSSPFEDIKQARRFCGPLPFTFAVSRKKNKSPS